MITSNNKPRFPFSLISVAAFFALLSLLPATSQQTVQTLQASESPANATSSNAALTGSAQTLSFNAATCITISVPSTADDTYLAFSGTATTANGIIPKGTAYTFNFTRPLTSVSVLGKTATGYVSWFTH